MDYLILIPVAFFAGMVDAVVGGGGLIQIPALLAQYPQTAIATLFGTNKISSIAGTGSAAWRFARTVAIPWRVVLPAAALALLGSWIGAALVVWMPPAAMRPLVIALLILVALYTFLRKEFGQTVTRELLPADRWRGMLLGLVIGLYDGFFGPGTGSFLLFAFVRFFGMDFLRASASAKFINVATNLAAIAYFAGNDNVMWKLGLCMAVSNVAGAQCGSLLALRRGSGFIRKMFLLVVVVLLCKQMFDLLAR